MSSRTIVCLAALAQVLLASAGPTALMPALQATDFRVENTVFLAGREEPISKSTTVFHEGVVYDLSNQTAETIILGENRRLFVLLDGKRMIRAEPTTKQIGSFVEELQQRAAKHSRPLIRFSATPKLSETFDAEKNELTLGSKWITYRLVLLKHDDQSIARQYALFSDWYSRLNTVLSRGSRPPSARLLVNAAMATRGATAKEVHLSLVTSEDSSTKPVKLRSEHQLTVGLEKSDLDRVSQARQQMKTFRLVKLEQYRQE
jgi:hypothetical protein